MGHVTGPRAGPPSDDGQTNAATGVSLLVAVPSPSCPDTFDPQHLMVPTPSRAHVWLAPVATATALVMPVTATAVSELVVVPLPS